VIIPNGGPSASDPNLAKELKREKTLRKVLKDELKKKSDRVQELEVLLEK
jgi:hypothetical protein